MHRTKQASLSNLANQAKPAYHFVIVTSINAVAPRNRLYRAACCNFLEQFVFMSLLYLAEAKNSLSGTRVDQIRNTGMSIRCAWIDNDPKQITRSHRT